MMLKLLTVIVCAVLSSAFALAEVTPLPDYISVSLERATQQQTVNPNEEDLTVRVTISNTGADHVRVLHPNSSLAEPQHDTFRFSLTPTEDATLFHGILRSHDYQKDESELGGLHALHDLRHVAYNSIHIPRGGNISMDVSPTEWVSFNDQGDYRMSVMLTLVRLSEHNNQVHRHFVETNAVDFHIAQATSEERTGHHQRRLLPTFANNCAQDHKDMISYHIAALRASVANAITELPGGVFYNKYRDDIKYCFDDATTPPEDNVLAEGLKALMVHLDETATAKAGQFTIKCDAAGKTAGCVAVASSAGSVRPTGWVVPTKNANPEITLCPNYLASQRHCAYIYHSGPNMLGGLILQGKGYTTPVGREKQSKLGNFFRKFNPNKARKALKKEERLRFVASWECFIARFSKDVVSGRNQCDGDVQLGAGHLEVSREAARIYKTVDAHAKIDPQKYNGGVTIPKGGNNDKPYQVFMTRNIQQFVSSYKKPATDTFKNLFKLVQSGSAKEVPKPLGNMIKAGDPTLATEVLGDQKVTCDIAVSSISTLLQRDMVSELMTLAKNMAKMLMERYLARSYDFVEESMQEPSLFNDTKAMFSTVGKLEELNIKLQFSLALGAALCTDPESPSILDGDNGGKPGNMNVKVEAMGEAVMSTRVALHEEASDSAKKFANNVVFMMLGGLFHKGKVDLQMDGAQVIVLALRRLKALETGNGPMKAELVRHMDLMGKVYSTVLRAVAPMSSLLAGNFDCTVLNSLEGYVHWGHENQINPDTGTFPVGTTRKRYPEILGLFDEFVVALNNQVMGVAYTIPTPAACACVSANPLRVLGDKVCDLECDTALCGNDMGDCGLYIKVMVVPTVNRGSSNMQKLIKKAYAASEFWTDKLKPFKAPVFVYAAWPESQEWFNSLQNTAAEGALVNDDYSVNVPQGYIANGHYSYVKIGPGIGIGSSGTSAYQKIFNPGHQIGLWPHTPDNQRTVRIGRTSVVNANSLKFPLLALTYLRELYIHEFGHSLGVGTAWDYSEDEAKTLDGVTGFIDYSDPKRLKYIAPEGVRVWKEMQLEYWGSVNENLPLPVDSQYKSDGTPKFGTYGVHWEDTTFAPWPLSHITWRAAKHHETMSWGTGRRLSKITLAALVDIGYGVHYDRVENYVMPTVARNGLPPATRRLQEGEEKLDYHNPDGEHGRALQTNPDADKCIPITEFPDDDISNCAPFNDDDKTPPMGDDVDLRPGTTVIAKPGVPRDGGDSARTCPA